MTASSPTRSSRPAAVAPTPALELFDATVSFDRTIVLDGATGSVERGGSLALIGPNGAGKSTLIRAILGVVPLTRGSIRVLGRAPADARIDVAYVPQIDALDSAFPISVAQVVLMGRYRRVGWLRWPSRADRAIAADALDRLGLTNRSGDRFGLLSGGQRQRVLIARAIAQRAKLLLLDEPFNGVDIATQEVLLEVLAELRADGTAVVMSTHDLAVAHLACDDCVLLNRQQIAFGRVAETLTSELLRETYGHPAMLMRAGQSMITIR